MSRRRGRQSIGTPADPVCLTPALAARAAWLVKYPPKLPGNSLLTFLWDPHKVEIT